MQTTQAHGDSESHHPDHRLSHPAVMKLAGDTGPALMLGPRTSLCITQWRCPAWSLLWSHGNIGLWIHQHGVLGNLQHCKPLSRWAAWVWECHDATLPCQMQTPSTGCQSPFKGFTSLPQGGNGGATCCGGSDWSRQHPDGLQVNMNSPSPSGAHVQQVARFILC